MIRCGRFVGCALVFLLLPALAPAAMEIHPRLSVEEEYTDNLYLDDANEEEDWITTVEPGLSLTYDNRSIEAVVDYSLRYRAYKNNDEENLDEFRDMQRADASVLLFGGRPFSLRVTETISRVALDERDDYEFNDVENRSTLYDLTVLPEYRWQIMPTLSLVTDYTYHRLDYVESRGNDSEEHRGRISLVKLVSPRTDVFLRYGYTAHQSDDDEEFDRQDVTAGLSWQLGARTNLSMEGGYADVEYDSGYTTESLTWLADLSYQLSEAVSFSLVYSEDFSVTAEDGLTERREAELSAHYTRESMTASTTVFWRNLDYLQEQREDEFLGIRGTLAKPLGRALTLNLDAEYANVQFDDVVEEEADRFTLGPSLEYAYRRFLASLGYRYRVNASDVDSNDYTNNIVFINGSVSF